LAGTLEDEPLVLPHLAVELDELEARMLFQPGERRRALADNRARPLQTPLVEVKECAGLE
jgi:hypothetical protein